MKTSRSLATLLPVLAGSLLAQSPPHLVGLSRNAPALRHHDHATCTVLGQCVVPGMPPATALPPYVGGTAWDPVHSGAWVSNGLLLGQVGDTCIVRCPPAVVPTLPANAFVTGLEVVSVADQLWLLDNQGRIHWYTNACPPLPLGGCILNTAIVGQSAPTGLAVDERNSLVFVALADFAAGTTTILFSALATPCVVIGSFTLPGCGGALGPVLGLACDWGNQILYATDGVRTAAVSYAWAAPNIVPGAVTCCPAVAAADPMIGLAIRPGRATSAGSPCAGAPCPVCPMQHTLVNDPCVGNMQFRLALDQAPANSFAWCLIGGGPCVPGATVQPLCGPIHTIPYLGALGVNVIGPAPACAGATDFQLPVPGVPALSGMVLSSQCVGLCFAGAVAGWTMSNCLSWQLQGN